MPGIFVRVSQFLSSNLSNVLEQVCVQLILCCGGIGYYGLKDWRITEHGFITLYFWYLPWSIWILCACSCFYGERKSKSWYDSQRVKLNILLSNTEMAVSNMSKGKTHNTSIMSGYLKICRPDFINFNGHQLAFGCVVAWTCSLFSLHIPVCVPVIDQLVNLLSGKQWCFLWKNSTVDQGVLTTWWYHNLYQNTGIIFSWATTDFLNWA